MGEPRIGPIGEDEFDAWARVFARAFAEDSHPDDRQAYRRVTEFDRTQAARDDRAIVGTAATLSFDISVPGGPVLPCAGVTAVGVLPTHRRRGLLTAMMRRLHDQAAERGEPLAALYASESPIYGRYGYGAAAPILELAVEHPWATLTRPATRARDVVLCEADEALERFPPVYERARAQRPGMMNRSGERWGLWLGLDEERHREGFSPRYHGLLDGRGYVGYRVRPAWRAGVPDGTLRVEELVATDPEAEAALWQFCFGVDLVARVEAPGRPFDDPLPLMVDNEARVRVTVATPFYLRLLDVGGALAGRAYAVEGSLVVDVADQFHPHNTGRWKLEAGPAGASCSRTHEAPDLACGVTELGAAYLGGRRFSQLAMAGRVVEHRRGAVAAADRMFAAARLPWNVFEF